MRTFEMYQGMYAYSYLPRYATYLLEQQLEPFIEEQLYIARAVNLPILKRLSHLTDEQLLTISKTSMTEFLGYLAQNKGKEQIETSLKLWVTDQLEVIGKFELLAEDITLINYVRSRSFRKFIPAYTSDMDLALHLIEEIDSFFMSSVTSATDTYISILKEVITKNEQELLEAQEIAHIGSFEWDLTGKKTKSSPEIYRIFGMEVGTRYHTFMEYVHPDDKAMVEEKISNALKEGSYDCEYRYTKDGTLKYIWAKGVIHFEGDKPIKMVGTVQDITERKKAEGELLQKTIALERSNQSLQQFAYVASHDLKEPVRKVATLADIIMIREQELSERSKTDLKKIHSSALRMRRMIDDIMAYSSLTHVQSKEEYSLQQVLTDVLEVLEQAIEEKGATVESDPLPVILMQPSQMRQLFQNLIGNALKFSHTDRPPKIEVRCTWLTGREVAPYQLPPALKYLQVSVQDNGIGFNVQHAEKIFTLFSRLHGRSDYEGSGIGLAIARKIIDNHEGTIFASAKEGAGSTFTFILPQ